MSKERLVKLALRDYFARSDLNISHQCTFERFELENFNSNDGFYSNIIFGYVVYKDKFGKEGRCESMTIKMSPNPNLRTRYMDITFSNEIFMYSRIIPFYATLDDSVLGLFPKFYYGSVALGDGENENAAIIVENLASKGYRVTDRKTFLDFAHLKLIVKRLARFHAFSYYAKSKQPSAFYSLVENLVNVHFTQTREIPEYLNLLADHFMKMLQNDPHYGLKINRVRESIKNADQFMNTVFTKREEPIAVLCHGDFLRNNLMVKYNPIGVPIDVKLFDLPSAKYCTPVVDLALILYMNADQEMRNDHWHDLLDAYCETLSETFPNVRVPTKDQIMDEMKIKALNAFLLASFFLPYMMRAEEPNFKSTREFYNPEYAEFVDTPWYDIPSWVIFKVNCKPLKPDHVEKVLDVLKDIIDRGFID